MNRMQEAFTRPESVNCFYHPRNPVAGPIPPQAAPPHRGPRRLVSNPRPVPKAALPGHRGAEPGHRHPARDSRLCCSTHPTATLPQIPGKRIGAPRRSWFPLLMTLDDVIATAARRSADQRLKLAETGSKTAAFRGEWRVYRELHSPWRALHPSGGRNAAGGWFGKAAVMKAIAAMSLNRVIGRAGGIPWHLPEDFRWFKRATGGQAVVMGRRTFESLGKPLPGRRNLVVSRGDAIEGAETSATSLPLCRRSMRHRRYGSSAGPKSTGSSCRAARIYISPSSCAK